jgi:hypothetical protein
MNEARLGVGFQAFVYASVAYLYAVNYARERLQGKDLDLYQDPAAPPVPIIKHPDVRRMLLWMKAHVDGMRSLVYYIGRCLDRLGGAQSTEEKERYQGLIDLLTPLVKAYCSQRGFDVCIQAIQVYGGYGYIKEYPLEQLARDCKITSIYEGTDGIQAMDLLGRKLGLKKGAVFMDFLQEIQKSIILARQAKVAEELTGKVEAAMNKLGETALHLGKTAMSPQSRKTAFAFSFPFLDAMGDLVMGWMLLWRAAVATEKLKSSVNKKDQTFYDGQIKTAEYFINAILPITAGKMDAIKGSSSEVVEISEASFGGL